MKLTIAKILMIVAAALCGTTAHAASLSWENPDVTLSSMAFTPTRLLILNDGTLSALDMSNGQPIAVQTAHNIDIIGNSDAGEAWACRYDISSSADPRVKIATLSPDGVIGTEYVIAPAQLEPAAYNGVKEHTFGPVTVAGSIADGSATVAFVEKIVANNQALTESLRLWRVYGCFNPAESLSARYSDLCLIEQYPYVTIFPDVNTQVALVTLTCSITDNSGDVPYFYTSRSATQQAKQRLTSPVLPDASLTGIRLATLADDTYFFYASKPGEVTMTLIDDPAGGFSANNIQYVSTLAMKVANPAVPAKQDVTIATATIDSQLAVALYAEGRALTLYRHASGSNGVGAACGDAPSPFRINGTTIEAYAPLQVYDLVGRRLLELPEGASACLPVGTYVLRTNAGSQVVALR